MEQKLNGAFNRKNVLVTSKSYLRDLFNDTPHDEVDDDIKFIRTSYAESFP